MSNAAVSRPWQRLFQVLLIAAATALVAGRGPSAHRRCLGLAFEHNVAHGVGCKFSAQRRAGRAVEQDRGPITLVCAFSRAVRFTVSPMQVSVARCWVPI